MLEEDEAERKEAVDENGKKKERKGLLSKLSSSVNTNFRDVQTVEKSNSNHDEDEEMQEDSTDDVICGPANLIDSKTVASKKWSEENESDTSDDSESDQKMKPELVKTEKRQEKPQEGDDSEEEATTIVL